MYIETILVKTSLNLHSEVRRNYLSYTWWILEPLLHMLIYYIVFGVFLMRGGENFIPFLLTGLIPWMWFMKTVSNTSNSIVSNQRLILQIGIPPIILPLVTVLQVTIKQVPVFMLLFIFLWSLGYHPTIHWVTFLFIFIVQALFITATSCAVAIFPPFMRDLSYLIPTGLTFMMFLSGIFYDYRTIAPEWQDWFLINPMAFLLKSYREILIENTNPDLAILSGLGLVSFIACLLIFWAYNKLRYIFPRWLLQ